MVALRSRRLETVLGAHLSYQFDDLDWQAIEAGIEVLTTEAETFTYPIVGQQELNVTLGRNPGGDEISLKITSRPDRLLAARITGLIDAFSQ